MPDLPGFAQFANQFGIAWAMLIFFAVAFWKGCKFIGRRLFDDEIEPSSGEPRGWVIRGIREHIKTMRVIQKESEETTKLIQQARIESEQRFEELKRKINCPPRPG